MHVHPRPSAGVALTLVVTLMGASAGLTAQAVENSNLTLRGTVIDGETGQPLHGVFIAPRGSDTGYLTHENGTFALPVLQQGTYVLYAELIGYETYDFRVPGPDPEPFVVTLRPDPIKLEGIRVLANRFERRRRGVAVTVNALTRADLLSAPALDVVDYMDGRLGISTSFCGGSSFASTGPSLECVLRRGQWIQPVIYIDEVRAFGGLDQLRQFRPQDLYALEVYDRGTTVLAYTNHFVDRVLGGNRRLMPLAFLR